MLGVSQNIIKVKEKTTIYPRKEAYFVDVLLPNGEVLETKEYKIVIDLSNKLKEVYEATDIQDEEWNQLIESIEKYGEHMYHQGIFDETYDG